MTFANSEAFRHHIRLVGAWEEFHAFAAAVRLVDIRVYGELPLEAEAWVRQFGEVGQTFRHHVAGFVRPPQ